MRFQGKITHWHDEQGYGFVTANGSNQQTFVHINAFHGVKRRPVNGDLITYEVVKDRLGRANADDVRFVRKPRLQKNYETTWYGSVFSILFISLLSLLVWLGKLHVMVLGFYFVASVVSYGLYAADKQAALRHTWRKEESTLQFVALMGGWPGALLAQKLLKHKNKKASFQRTFWAAAVTNIVVFGLAYHYDLLH